MVIEQIYHLVVTVSAIVHTCNFYARVLGMEVTTFGGGCKALRFGLQKINLPDLSEDLQPKALAPIHKTSDLCLITKVPFEEVLQYLQDCQVEILVSLVR